MTKYFYAALMLILVAGSCGKSAQTNPFDPNAPKPTAPAVRPASLGILGDTTDVNTATKAGVVIMGGSTDVDAAFKWMLERSGGGDVVVIRSTGTNAYNTYINSLGKAHSVETLKIDSRAIANDPKVAHIIRNAELLFIAGGDQSDYVNYWKGTKVMDAINYLLVNKKVPVGGTSAGAAILGNYYFGALQGGVEASEALSNPYNPKISLGKDDFLKVPYLQNVITDQHFSQRSREGRIGIFLGRMLMDWSIAANAIAVDEKTAVCIDEHGIATVVGDNKAYFLTTAITRKPEIFSAGSTVTWNNEGKAIQVRAIAGTVANNKFNVLTFEPVNTDIWSLSWWYFVSGSLMKTN